jgi:hypothetical protein
MGAVYPSHDMSWAVASLKGATTFPHIDTAGLASMISVLCGAKYWVILRRKDAQLTEVDAFGDDWSPSAPPSDQVYDAEGLLLTKGSVL